MASLTATDPRVLAAVAAAEVEDPMTGENITFAGPLAVLSAERVAVFQTSIPKEDWKAGLVVTCTVGGEGEKLDYVFIVSQSADNTVTAKAVISECGITLEEFPPTGMVQYQFASDGPWRVSVVCLDALMAYRGAKFTTWLGGIKKPVCAAAFRRMLQIGLITTMYDALAFPEDEEDAKKYVVTDSKSGKTHRIPHPVHALRVWNANEQKYDSIDPQLDGAPVTEEERTKFWGDLIETFKAEHGAEYIDNVLAGREAE